jgi:enamine deaminase RidA (YjgF/YER057c/UK114 family)
MMTEVIKVKSGSVFEERESYSRVCVVGDWIFMSNTAGRNYETREMAADVLGQAEQAFRNVEGALAAVGATLADVVRSRVFIPYREDAASVMQFVGEKFRGIDPASTVTCSPLGSPDYRFEIEVTAYRGAGKLPQQRKTVAL